MVAAVCGDSMVWKPSSKTPLTALATHRVVERVVAESDDMPEAKGIFNLTIGPGRAVGEALISDRRVPLVSATGSCRMGRRIGSVVGERLGRSLLELGGNNGVIVLDDADLDMALRAVLFGAVGTTGQRCTTIRRLLLQKGIAGEFTGRLLKAYEGIRIGDPLDDSTVMGPLVDGGAVDDMMAALELVPKQGGEVICGGGRIDRPGHFVEPTLVKAHPGMELVQEETFAPILYLIEVGDLDEAIEIHNAVPQGLSSSIFTNSLRAVEKWHSAEGSDCGIANVNISTSGAEIGGAFGGEKDTGGGREAGSDAWKAYMRRQTCTVNWGTEMPLAQGIEFGDS
jgi:aldehyde dehydrogenase (NAD+)